MWKVIVVTAVHLATLSSASAAATLYLASSGSDANSCLSAALPCATLNGAIAKAAAADTVLVATGTYTASGSEVVKVDKGLTLSGATRIFIRYNNTSWHYLHPASASRMVTGNLDAMNGDEVIIDFGPTYGIWVYRHGPRPRKVHSPEAESPRNRPVNDGNGNGRTPE